MAGDHSREKALEVLKKQIAEQRARIDPDVLKRAEAAIAAAQAPAAAAVPYDREAARQAVDLFLKSHGDAKSFGLKLAALLRKDTN